jgi:hypothetical protein
VPTGAVGQFNIVNVTEARSGVVRFAGYATERFATNEAFHLRVTPKRDLTAVSFLARLDVAGTIAGAALHKDHLPARAGLHDSRSGALLSK